MRGAHYGTGAGTSHAAPEGFKIFESNEFGQVPVVAGEDGEPWFVAKDVCDVLGIAPTQTRRLDEDEKGLYTMQPLGVKQQVQVVNESGLYHFTITSRKEFAKRFRKWVTSDVAPTIRKHCVYAADKASEQKPKRKIQALRNLQHSPHGPQARFTR